MAPQVFHRRFELHTGITIAADLHSVHGDPFDRDNLAAHGATWALFLHGGGQTRHAWGGTAAYLATRGIIAMTMDHRGHGQSSWAADGDYLFDAFARDLMALLPALPTKPFLVGASLGGMASLAAEARLEGTACKGLILVDVTPRLERTGVVRILDFMASRPEGYASLDEVADAVAAYVPHRTRPKTTAGLEKNLRLGDDGRYRWHWDPALLKSFDPKRYTPAEGQRIVAERLEACAKLTVPTLLIRGRRSDVVSEENAREFLDAVPHARYVNLKDAAHMVAGDRNDAFTEAVEDFIARHAEPS